MDPRTGRVLAMVGGWSHDISPFNRATQAQRQPGSSVKPFVYLTAMEQNIQPDAPVLDAPLRAANGGRHSLPARQLRGEFPGPGADLPRAGTIPQPRHPQPGPHHRPRQHRQKLPGFGIIDQMPPYYPSAIGAIDTTLWRMVTGYAALDEYGRQVTPTLIDSVTNPDGNVLYQADEPDLRQLRQRRPVQPPQLDLSGAQLADPDRVFQIITMMKGVVLRGTGQPAVAGITQPVAGKTGTTNNFNDAWFIGFTPGMLTGCWIGFDTPQNLGKNQTGGNVCGPIWNEYMKMALADQPPVDFAVPTGMTLQTRPNPTAQRDRSLQARPDPRRADQ